MIGMSGLEICLICRDKNNTYMLNKLRSMFDRLRSMGHEPMDAGIRTVRRGLFNWGIHSRCQYGVHCDTLTRYDSQCKSLAEQMEPYIVAVAIKGNEHDYHDMLEWFRGDFPAVYNTAERIRREKYVEE